MSVDPDVILATVAICCMAILLRFGIAESAWNYLRWDLPYGWRRRRRMVAPDLTRADELQRELDEVLAGTEYWAAIDEVLAMTSHETVLRTLPADIQWDFEFPPQPPGFGHTHHFKPDLVAEVAAFGQTKPVRTVEQYVCDCGAITTGLPRRERIEACVDALANLPQFAQGGIVTTPTTPRGAAI